MDETIVTDSDKFYVTETSLTVGLEVTYDEWLEYGKQLAKRYSGIQWQIGDWINWGEKRWGEMYAQAEDDTGFAYGTLRNYASICARIPPENRDSKLRFHQTKHVACLTPNEQQSVIQFAIEYHLTGEDVLETVNKITGKDHKSHDNIEGEVVRSYAQEDGFYFVVKLKRDSLLKLGQLVTIKGK